jgi:hypothetical protein
MRLADHVTLNFNNKMFTAAVFLDIEKAFDTTWHSGLLYKLSKLEFSKFDQSYWVLSFRTLVQSFGRTRNNNAKRNASGVPQSSVLSPTLFNLYINDAPPQTHCVHLDLFAEDTCLYATDRKDGFIVRKLQRGLSSLGTWCERWNIKMS